MEAIKWSGEAWKAAEPIYEKILELPFVKGLADGTLDPERFRFYLRQDVLYIRRYARRLLMLAARLPRGSVEFSSTTKGLPSSCSSVMTLSSASR